MAPVEVTSQYSQTESFSYENILANLPPDEKEKLEKYIDSTNPVLDKSTTNLTMPQTYLRNFREKKKKDESFPKSIFRAIDILEKRILKMK